MSGRLCLLGSGKLRSAYDAGLEQSLGKLLESPVESGTFAINLLVQVKAAVERDAVLRPPGQQGHTE